MFPPASLTTANYSQEVGCCSHPPGLGQRPSLAQPPKNQPCQLCSGCQGGTTSTATHEQEKRAAKTTPVVLTPSKGRDQTYGCFPTLVGGRASALHRPYPTPPPAHLGLLGRAAPTGRRIPAVGLPAALLPSRPPAAWPRCSRRAWPPPCRTGASWRPAR